VYFFYHRETHLGKTLALMIQLKTQTAEYWQEDLVIDDQDLEHLYGLILEGGVPQTLDPLALALMEWRCRSEEATIKAELEKGELYRPGDSYKVGQQVVFPALGYALATVTEVRPGYNPQYDPFEVIKVRFEDQEGIKEFAAKLDHPHKLNAEENDSELPAGRISPAQLYALYGSQVKQRLEKRLQAGSSWEFVNFGDEWFLKGLVADIHVGHLNVAEAALDVEGTSLSPEELLKVLELPTDLDQPAQVFSLNYALMGDNRFDDVGTDDNIVWFLRRLEPPEAIHPPRRLQYSPQPYSRETISSELLELEREIEDEATEPTVFGPYPQKESIDTATFTLTYPHYRVGTIPLTPRLAALFPQSSTQRTRITIIDGRSGRKMTAWVVHQYKYVFGLDKWYEEYHIPVGAYIKVGQTKDPLTFIVDYEPRRMKREWIRVAKVVEGKLTFEMQKQPIGCQYDEPMIVGEDKPSEVDSFWVATEETEKPIFELICEIFPELAKLSPQGTVHAKTLYSAINVVRRCPPGPIFAELCTQDCFNSVGGGYWTMTA
jgi:hypothetical protein